MVGSAVEESGGPREAREGASLRAPRAHLEIRDLHHRLGARELFRGLSCSFERGKITVVLGSSGVGKSTLLRMICCLMRPDSGEILVDGHTELTSMPERQARVFRRQIGMMFQGGALLDSMTVYDNVALPLREHTSKGEAEIADEIARVFRSVGLDGVNSLLPGELSGGMMKRAALARALILHPDLLLADEPFSGLDPATVRLVESSLVGVNRALGITMILTSHHIPSTLRSAHRVVLLADGKAICGTAEELRRSRDRRVVEFLAETEPEPPGSGAAP